MTQCQLNTVLAHFIVYKSSYIGIKGIHKLFWTLDNGDLHSQFTRFSASSNPNEATTCQYGRLRMVYIDVIFDAEGVLHRVRRVNSLSRPKPGSLGWVGLAPGERISLS